MHRLSLLVTLLLLAAAGLWWATRHDGPQPTPSPTAPASAPVAAPSSPAAAPPAPAPRQEAAATAPGLAIRVLDPEKNPVPGVAIEVLGDDPDFRLPPTSADGVARADRLPLDSVWFRARHDGCTGTTSWRWASPLQRELTLRLVRDRDVEVTVTDTNGAPCADVEVSLLPPSGESAASKDQHRTGPDGTAHITLPGTDWLALQPGVRARASAGHGRDRAESDVVPFAATGVTRCRVVLTRSPEPTSGLTVHFVDATGAPTAAHGRLSWSVVISASTRGTFAWRSGQVDVDGPSTLVTGIVGGDDLSLTLYEPDRLEARQRVQIPSGVDRHDATMRRGALAPQLEVPLVDAHGAPVTTGTFVLFARHTNGHTREQQQATPDARGIVRLVLPATTAGTLEVAWPFAADVLHWPPQQGVPRPYYTSIGTPPPPPPCLAVRAFPALADTPVHRVEAVVVPALAATISGRVVDADGRPAAGVRIGITTTTAPEPAVFAAFQTRSDAAGRFRIQATTLPDEVCVFARRPGAFCPPQRARPAADTTLELVLQPTGTLVMALRRTAGLADGARSTDSYASVALVLDESALTDGAWGLFRDRAMIGGADLLQRWHLLRYVQEDGDLLFDDLVPATYEVRAAVGTTRLVTARDVVVHAGATTRPPQLDGLVLGNGVEAVVVRVAGADGKPLRDARVRFQLPEWRETHPGGVNRATDAQGEAWFVVPRNTVTDIDVVAAGLAPLRLTGVRFPLDVRLGAGATCAVALRGHEALRRDVRALVVVCRPHGDTPPDTPVQSFRDMVQLHHPQATVGDDGRAAIPNLPPGRWRIWLAALPPLTAARGAGIPFVLLGDRDVATVDASTIDVAHELTAAELATLRGQ